MNETLSNIRIPETPLGSCLFEDSALSTFQKFLSTQFWCLQTEIMLLDYSGRFHYKSLITAGACRRKLSFFASCHCLLSIFLFSLLFLGASQHIIKYLISSFIKISCSVKIADIAFVVNFSRK